MGSSLMLTDQSAYATQGDPALGRDPISKTMVESLWERYNIDLRTALASVHVCTLLGAHPQHNPHAKDYIVI